MGKRPFFGWGEANGRFAQLIMKAQSRTRKSCAALGKSFLLDSDSVNHPDRVISGKIHIRKGIIREDEARWAKGAWG